jgi:hypothetical protein
MAEFGAGVQAGHDDLDPGHLLLRMLVNGHAPSVVDDLQRPVLEKGDLDAVGEASNGFVDGIVDDLMGQVVRPGGVGVHARPSFNRIESTQNFEIRCIVMIRVIFHPLNRV